MSILSDMDFGRHAAYRARFNGVTKREKQRLPPTNISLSDKATFQRLAKELLSADGLSVVKSSNGTELHVEGKDAANKVRKLLEANADRETLADSEIDGAVTKKQEQLPMSTFSERLDALGRMIETLEKKQTKLGFDEQIDDAVEQMAADDDSAETEEDSDQEDDEQDEKTSKQRFQKVVDRIAARDNIAKVNAMSVARLERPDLFRRLQRVDAERSYEDLVTVEIRKGCSPTVAAQRVALLYPRAAQSTINKSDRAEAEFMRSVAKIADREGISDIEAMRAARTVHPEEFRRFQAG